MDNKLEKLNQLLSLMQNDTVTPKQLEKFIFDVLEVIKKAKNSFDTMSEEGEKMYSETIDKVVSVCEEQIKSLQEIQSKTISEIDTRVAEKKLEIENFLNEIKKIKATPGKNGEPGKDGKDADEQHIIEQVLKNIPTPKELVLNGEDVVSVINELPTEEKYLIDASHIKNLPIKGNGSTGVRMLKRLVDVDADGATNGQTLIYNSTTGTWEAGAGGGGGSGWGLTGNAGTTAGTNFVGTTDDIDFVLKTSGVERMRIKSSAFSGATGTAIYFPSSGNTEFYDINDSTFFGHSASGDATFFAAASNAAYIQLNSTGVSIENATLPFSLKNQIDLRFYEGVNYVGFKAGALAGNTIWTLPTTDSTGTQALVSNGAGVLSWATMSGGLSDGDYGDITVSGSGTVVTIDNNVVSLAKMATMATDSFLGRDTAGTGNVEVLSVATAKTLLDLSGTNTGNETTSTLGSTINGASAATPNDTDLVATVESSVVKKITWTNVKAFLKTYFDTLYVSRTEMPVAIQIACSDLTTVITAGTSKAYFRVPYAFTLQSVRASLLTAQTGGSLFTVDINDNGSSILSTKITLDNNETTSTTAATAPVISSSSMGDDRIITIDVDTVGTGSPVGLIVTLIGKRTI